MGINDADQIVGTYIDTSGQTHGYVLSDGTFAAINYPLAIDTVAWGIKDDGQIVGGYLMAGGYHGFLYNPNGGTYTTFDVP